VRWCKGAGAHRRGHRRRDDRAVRAVEHAWPRALSRAPAYPGRGSPHKTNTARHEKKVNPTRLTQDLARLYDSNSDLPSNCWTILKILGQLTRLCTSGENGAAALSAEARPRARRRSRAPSRAWRSLARCLATGAGVIPPPQLVLYGVWGITNGIYRGAREHGLAARGWRCRRRAR
jgi:hypothetical protein